MKLLIDIPDEVGNEIRNSGKFCYEDRFNGKTLVAYMHRAIKEGVVLPKHGRLIDADELKIGDIIYKDESQFRKMLCRVNHAPTVLEASKE